MSGKLRGIAWILFGMLLLMNASNIWLPVISAPVNIIRLVGLIISFIGLILATFTGGGDDE